MVPYPNPLFSRTALGNMNVLQVKESPAEAAVMHDIEYYYTDIKLKQTPLSMLLPVIHLEGNENTKNGCWNIISESELCQIFAFLHVLREKLEKGPVELANKMKKAAGEVDVLLLKIKQIDGMWLEWNAKQTTSHQDLQHSPERCTVRCKFFTKIEVALRQEFKKKEEKKKKAEKKEFTKKDFAKAFMDAEAEGKFSTAKGNIKVQSEQDVTKVMNLATFLSKIPDMLDLWEGNEIWEEGKTPLFYFTFGHWFPGACNDDPKIGLWVLKQIDNVRIDNITGKSKLTKKKILEANGPRMKDFVKTLILEYNWMADLQANMAGKPIMSAERMGKEMAELQKVWGDDQSGFDDLVADEGGIQATLHPLTLEVLVLFIKVAKQEEFNRFSTAEALHKSFSKTCESDILVDFFKPVVDKWTDAHNHHTGQEEKDKKKDKDPEREDDEEEENKKPTRSVAIREYAAHDVKTYLPTYVKTGDAQVDRQKLLTFAICLPLTSETAPRNLETQGNRRVFVLDENGRKNPNWAYVKGRNEYRGKVGLERDVLEEDVGLWTVMAAPGEGPRDKKVDVFTTYNCDQAAASRAILQVLKPIRGVEVKKVILRGKQEDLERRLKQRGNMTDTLGDLDGVPGMSEECYQAFAGSLPTRREHRYTNAGIVDNVYPEEVIPLPNPALMEPLVTHELRKRIFAPLSDGNTQQVQRDEPAPTEKADKEDKNREKLCTYGRDEKYVENALWLLGASNVVVHGVGNGMIPWVCLKWRIPCVCIYDCEEHQKCVHEFITKKVENLMKKAVPANTRWWKSNDDLNCIPDVDEKTEKDKKKRTAAALDDDEKKEKKKKKSKSSSSSSTSSSSSSSKKSKTE